MIAQTVAKPNPTPATPRRHRLTTAALIAAGLLLVLILGRGLMLDPKKIPSALLNQPARAFTVDVLQGGEHINLPPGKSTFTLADLAGHPVILNFWASWCVSCREEAREFEAFWQQVRSQGIIVAGIAIQDTPEAAMKFARGFGKTYLLGLDNSGNGALDYGVTGVPETFLIDRAGIVRYKEAGPMSMALLNEKLPLILN